MTNDGWQIYKPPKPKTPKPKTHSPPKPRPPKKPHYTNPFAPQSDAQLQAQASAQQQAAMGPIIKAITDAINQRSLYGTQAISGLTRDLGGLFAQTAPQTKAAYDQAQGAQSAVNTQLANRLGAFGSGLAAEQGTQLASINAPAATAAVTGQTGQTATGSANAQFASGSAEIGKLIAQSAAGQAYGAKLPGIAGLTGIQNEKQLQAQLSHELATQLSQAQANAAQQVSSTYQHLKDLELQKAIANQSGQYKAGQLALDAQYKAAQVAYNKALLRWKAASKKADQAMKKAQQSETAHHNATTEAQQRANEAGRNARARKAREAAAKKKKKQPGGSNPWAPAP